MTKVERAMDKLSSDDVKELEAMPPEQLSSRIVAANEAMRQVAEELDNNSAYQRVKEDKAALEAGKKEVNKRQKAIIEVCLHLRNERGAQ